MDPLTPLDTLCRIILRAREYEAQTASDYDPGEDPDNVDDEQEGALSVLEDDINTSVEEEIRSVLEDLGEDQLAEVIAFCWVGQGTYEAGDWDEAFEEAMELARESNDEAIDEVMNTAEFYVHHEDVRRAQPGWVARELSESLQRALWRSCATAGRLALRQADVGIELVAPGFGRTVVRRGHPMVRVEGPPSELLLWAFGRRAVAQVHLDGPNGAVDRLQGSAAGL